MVSAEQTHLWKNIKEETREWGDAVTTVLVKAHESHRFDFES